MASRRALIRLPLRSTPSAVARHAYPLQRAAPCQLFRTAVPQPADHLHRPTNQARWHSSDHGSKSKVYDFNGIKTMLAHPDPDVMLIDVREPAEYEAGFIPTAYNIPIASQPDALFLPPDEFEDRFGFSKPPPSKELVFYCKAGVRSRAAAQLAQQGGYERVGEYKGSWLDWERQGGPGSKDPKGDGGVEPPV